MMMICPDCPTLISLDSPEGIKSVNEGVKKFNQNTTNQRYYILQEVGRISSAVQIISLTHTCSGMKDSSFLCDYHRQRQGT